MNTDASGARGAAATADQARPLGAAANRIASLDFVRGIAVLGILAANIAAFGQPMLASMWPGAALVPQDRAGDLAYVAQFVLIDGKMRGLFSMLFGAGIVLFLERARAAGSGDTLHLRRLFWLLMFGVAHYFLIWRGDILGIYAVCGLLAMACVDWRPRALLLTGVGVYLLAATFFAISYGGLYAIVETPFGLAEEMVPTRTLMIEAAQTALGDAQLEGRIIATGSYAQFVAHNFVAHGGEWGASVLISAFEIVPLILMGMGLYKFGLFDGRANARRQMIWGGVGVIAGIVLSIPIALWLVEEGFSYYGTVFALAGLGPIARLPMTLGLLAVLALWGQKKGGWLYSRLSACGRMAFSNYIGTSIVMMLVFHGWAGGLFGRFDRIELYLVMLAVWVLMLSWSKPWLDHFRFGPLEWAWRCLTYGKLFPLRRRA